MYGKRQTFPMPMAQPAEISTNPSRDANFSLSIVFSPSLQLLYCRQSGTTSEYSPERRGCQFLPSSAGFPPFSLYNESSVPFPGDIGSDPPGSNPPGADPQPESDCFHKFCNNRFPGPR